MRFTTFISLALAGFSLTNALAVPGNLHDIPKLDGPSGGKKLDDPNGVKKAEEHHPTGKQLQKEFCEKLATPSEGKECARNLKICRSVYHNKERKTTCELDVLRKFSATDKGKQYLVSY
uniref:Cellophane-induced protein 1-like 1 n=1 Tax=Venturia pyrina TaxID=415593 RepID=G5CJT2_9PEZI|nr:cellophane-induced protein 1-like 1 [Venturia pyrina]